jgi:hypothetical protein
MGRAAPFANNQRRARKFQPGKPRALILDEAIEQAFSLR